MRIITKMLKQRAVYWAPKPFPASHGKRAYEEPIVIKCRWQDSDKEFKDVTGTVRTSMAKVFVDRDLVPLGVLYLSTLPLGSSDGAVLAELTSETDPFAQKGHEIGKFNKIPTLSARKFVRIAYL